MNTVIRKEACLANIIADCPENKIIGESLIKAYNKINDPKYKKIVCSISGGSDSDVMMDLCYMVDKDNKIEYVWFDTGLEYQATKDHLKYLEEKYNITIKIYRAIKAIPISCKLYGQPFISKHVSEMLRRLQKHNFQFEDKPFDELIKEYPKCKSALEWWCNVKPSDAHNIANNKWLKEFLIKYPPSFKISNVCCKYAKKDVAHQLILENNYDLHIVGIRKSEGGTRAKAYKSCFDDNGSECDNYRPLFWYKDKDKAEYEKHYNVEHSKCYTEYGLKRTGCAGCPFGRDFEYELSVIDQYESKLYKAVNNIFKEAYEYTRKYKTFYKEMDQKEKDVKEVT